MEKTDKLVDFLMQYDFNNDGFIDNEELQKLLEHYRGKNEADDRNLRTIIHYVMTVNRIWKENPEYVDKKMSSSKAFWASWDDDKCKAKLQKIICTFYRGGLGEKIEEKLEKMAKDAILGEIKSWTYEATITPILQKFLEDMFGEFLGEFVVGILLD